MLHAHAREIETDREHHRQQQEDAEQLHHDRGVADRRRDGIAGAHHLRHVMDGAAEHDAGGLGVEAEPLASRRIDQHRQGRERIDPDDDERNVRLFTFVFGNDGRDRQRGGSPAYAGRNAGQSAEARRLAARAGEQEAGAYRGDHRHDDEDRGFRPQRSDVRQTDAQAQQRHRPAQDRAHAKGHAGSGGRTCGERIERDPDQQRDHHARKRDHLADVRGGRIGGGRDDPRQDDAGSSRHHRSAETSRCGSGFDGH